MNQNKIEIPVPPFITWFCQQDESGGCGSKCLFVLLNPEALDKTAIYQCSQCDHKVMIDKHFWQFLPGCAAE